MLRRLTFCALIALQMGCQDNTTKATGGGPGPTVFYYAIDGLLPGMPTYAAVSMSDFGGTMLASKKFDNGVTSIAQDSQYFIPYSTTVSAGDIVYISEDRGDYLEYSDMARIDLISTDILQVCDFVGTFAGWYIPSYLTTLSCGIVMNGVDNNDSTWGNQYLTDNKIMGNYSGITDIVSTDYDDINNSAYVFNGITDSLKNTLYLVAISQLTQDWATAAGYSQHERPYTSLDFIAAAYSDIRADGVLDGKGVGGGPVYVGGQQLTTNTYRHDLAKALMEYTENTNNTAGLSKVQLKDFAVSVNDSTASIFGSEATVPLNEGGPYITNYLPADKSTVKGDSQFSAHVHDTCGFYSATFLIDGAYYAGNGTSTYPVDFDATYSFYVPVFQAAGTTGVHSLIIQVDDVCGGGAQIEHFVTFDNT